MNIATKSQNQLLVQQKTEKRMHLPNFHRFALVSAGIMLIGGAIAISVFVPKKSQAAKADYPWPSFSISDTLMGEANSIYARLSISSRQLLSNICDQVNRSGKIPDGYFFPEKIAFQFIAKWGAKFAENPKGVLAALEDAAKSAKSVQHRSETDRIVYLNVLAQLQFFRELSNASPEQQKKLLDEAGKTYTGLLDGQ